MRKIHVHVHIFDVKWHLLFWVSKNLWRLGAILFSKNPCKLFSYYVVFTCIRLLLSDGGLFKSFFCLLSLNNFKYMLLLFLQDLEGSFWKFLYSSPPDSTEDICLNFIYKFMVSGCPNWPYISFIIWDWSKNKFFTFL